MAIYIDDKNAIIQIEERDNGQWIVCRVKPDGTSRKVVSDKLPAQSSKPAAELGLMDYANAKGWKIQNKPAEPKYGRLVPIEQLVTSQNRWIFACDCGKATVAPYALVKNGNTKSCGCIKKEMYADRRKDLTGLRVGKLTVIGPVKIPGSMWQCKCDCGNEKELPTSSITSGEVKSCGCSQYVKST